MQIYLLLPRPSIDILFYFWYFIWTKQSWYTFEWQARWPKDLLVINQNLFLLHRVNVQREKTIIKWWTVTEENWNPFLCGIRPFSVLVEKNLFLINFNRLSNVNSHYCGFFIFCYFLFFFLMHICSNEFLMFRSPKKDMTKWIIFGLAVLSALWCAESTPLGMVVE